MCIDRITKRLKFQYIPAIFGRIINGMNDFLELFNIINSNDINKLFNFTDVSNVDTKYQTSPKNVRPILLVINIANPEAICA